MAALEDIHKGARVHGIVSSQAVQILSMEWVGGLAISVVYRDHKGDTNTATLYREDEPRLEIQSPTQPFDGDGALFRLVTEANRIELAHHFDPYLAIHTSLIDPLPHQISAVYGVMLSRQPLRFLLADDPGAGKTIMAGLLIKELIARSDLERCLIVAPGSLVEQWQDELNDKFDLKFDIFTNDMAENSLSGNPFEDHDHLIVRLDALARNEELQKKLIQSREWDMIICDEAHRMSASYFNGETKYTKRYQLGQKLGQICRHFLLMSATPHSGSEQNFQLFMALLDGDRFDGRFRENADKADMMRRLTKEDLRRFDGSPLFPERYAYTVKYPLSPKEAALYTAVTAYVREEMNRVLRFAAGEDKKRNTVGFALQILQRRLASSPAAIYQSLRRRRERLEKELTEARQSAKGWKPNFPVSENEEEAFDDDQEEIDTLEAEISTGASSSETIEELSKEVDTLKRLEQEAFKVLHAGEDAKWTQLSRILDDDLMLDAEGARRKLIIFTEAKDTLHYLQEKIIARLGKPEAVEVIHGGVSREARRDVIKRFMQDRDLLVLVANDAAGEGVNLQRGHLMVNYDLPWNPNKIEQRFGRIHRIGQTEVCHLWNLVAADTREGEVYGRLLEKLETARKALGGQVFDVLGALFEGIALKDLLIEAIQYGDDPKTKASLFQKVDGAVDQDHLVELLKKRALTNDSMPEARVEELRLEMERAATQRLQPHHIQSFFVEAFQHLGGQMKRREEGRWEITHVPLCLRDRDRQIGFRTPLQPKYERICFEKTHIHQQPVAAFLCPGHPLLKAVLSVIRERYGPLMQQGAILVDKADSSDDVRAIFLLEHSVQDSLRMSTDRPHIVSRRLQFATVDRQGRTANAGIAPHLDLHPATAEERALALTLWNTDWLTDELEKQVEDFATIELARRHITEVRTRRLPEIEKIEQEVRECLTKGINYWDFKAGELKEEERAGKKTRLSWENAQRRADDLQQRLKRRMTLLAQEKILASQAPHVRGRMVAVPKRLLTAGTPTSGFCADAQARQAIEQAAMQAVLSTERTLGNTPKDVSAKKCGYDIESYDPKAKQWRFIEVKGRVSGAENVMITRQEIITSLHEPEKYILAVVLVEEGRAHEPRYIRGALDTHEPSFEKAAIQFKLGCLLEKSREPA